MIEKKEKPKPKPLIETIKQRIKYLEEKDPHNKTLEMLKQHISEQDPKILPHYLTFILSQKGTC